MQHSEMYAIEQIKLTDKTDEIYINGKLINDGFMWVESSFILSTHITKFNPESMIMLVL